MIESPSIPSLFSNSSPDKKEDIEKKEILQIEIIKSSVVYTAEQNSLKKETPDETRIEIERECRSTASPCTKPGKKREQKESGSRPQPAPADSETVETFTDKGVFTL